MAIMRSESGSAGDYLACEKWPVYALMMLAGGYFGAFTYAIRGGVFCNAQSGNVVLLSMALSRGEWGRAGYLLIPITAYCLGAFVSEAAARGMGKRRLIRWETALVLFEMLAVLFLGALPETAPVQITQVLVNFMCSMQYNTFRQAQGIPMATTFCTNHIRQGRGRRLRPEAGGPLGDAGRVRGWRRGGRLPVRPVYGTGRLVRGDPAGDRSGVSAARGSGQGEGAAGTAAPWIQEIEAGDANRGTAICSPSILLVSVFYLAGITRIWPTQIWSGFLMVSLLAS